MWGSQKCKRYFTRIYSAPSRNRKAEDRTIRKRNISSISVNPVLFLIYLMRLTPWRAEQRLYLDDSKFILPFVSYGMIEAFRPIYYHLIFLLFLNAIPWLDIRINFIKAQILCFILTIHFKPFDVMRLLPSQNFVCVLVPNWILIVLKLTDIILFTICNSLNVLAVELWPF